MANKMNPKLRKTIISLRILSVVNFVIGGIVLLLSFGFMIFVFPIAAFIIGYGVFIELIIKDLKQKKYWAWVAGVVVSGLAIPSILFIPGIVGLIGLLDTQKDFKK